MEKTTIGAKGVAPAKASTLIWLTLLTWLGISVWSWREFAVCIPSSLGLVLVFSLKLVYLPWMLFWLWGIHNFWHQTLSLFRGSKTQSEDCNPEDSPPVVILYTTCDDFEPEACLSCIQQSYCALRVIICDDSSDEYYRHKVDSFAAQYRNLVTVVRRPNRNGFKAGNLNYALERFVAEEFVVLCDADEVLPTKFVTKLLKHLQPRSFAFAQARHQVTSTPATHFATQLGFVTNIFFDYSLPLRNRFGFVSCFGHGVMIRRSVWQEIGGFPLMASEDLAFASRALVQGYRGVYVDEVTAQEAYPATYTALVKKYRRVVEGTIEYFHKEYLRLFTSSRATWTEKLDLLLTYSSCYVGVVATLNVVGGLLLISANAANGYRALTMKLLVLYLVGPFTPIVPLLVKMSRAPIRYSQLFLCAAVAYTSLLPMLALRGIRQIVKPCAPFFEPTGKIGKQSQRFRDHLLTEATGLIIIAVSGWLHSQSSVPAAGLGAMLILGPFLCYSEQRRGLGLLARNSGFLPYLIMVVLFLVWE